MIHRGRRRRRTGERGETLIEIVITIAIMGIAVPAIIGAVLIAVDSSSQDRRMAMAQRLLASWSESIAQNTSDANYVGCNPPDYTTAPYAVTPLPPGFQLQVASVDYWHTSSFSTACPDEGIRRLQLRVVVATGLYPAFDADRYVLVRKPCAGTTC